MAEPWVDVTLGECAQFLSGGTPRKSRPEYWNGELPWVTAKDLKTLRIRSSGKRVTELGAASGTTVVDPGAVLMLVRGMTLHSNVPIALTRTRAAFNQDIKALLPSDQLDGEYLAYLLLSRKEELLHLVDSASHGTGRIHLRLLRDLKVSLPPVAEQKARAAVLSSLDDYIEHTRDLAMLARGVLASAFARAVEGSSELRPLVRGTDPAADVDYGSAFDGEYFTRAGEGRPLIRIRDLKTHIPAVWTTETRGDETLLSAGDLLVGMDAEFRPVIWLGDEGVLNQRVCRIRPVDGVPISFLLEAIRGPLAYYERAKTGTTVSHLNKSDIDMIEIPRLSQRALDQFGRAFDPLIELEVLLAQSASSLWALRRRLLRPVVSGSAGVGNFGRRSG